MKRIVFASLVFAFALGGGETIEAAPQKADKADKTEKAEKAPKPKRNEKIWPLFEGGTDETFAAWIGERLVFPETSANSADKLAVIGFTVDEKGGVVKIHTLENPDPVLGEQIKTVLDTSPVWTPGYRKKKPEETTYYLFVKPAGREVRLVSERNGEFVAPAFDGGGVGEFRKWMIANMKYPEYAKKMNIQGRVEIRFVVDRQGRPTLDKIVSAGDQLLVAEVLRVLALSHEWTPGTLEGVTVPVYFTVPFEFMIGSAYALEPIR